MTIYFEIKKGILNLRIQKHYTYAIDFKNSIH